MAAELYRHQPVFQAIVDRCAVLLRDRLERPLLDVLFAPADGADAIHETAYTQPALFVVQAALTELYRSWGIVPDAVLGHSVGEFAAAYCAGVYTLEDALSLITERARLMQSLPRAGAMAAIFADESAVVASLGNADSIAIAAVNAPGNTVISGERDAVAAAVAQFATLGDRIPAADRVARIPFAVDAADHGRIRAHRRNHPGTGRRSSLGSRRRPVQRSRSLPTRATGAITRAMPFAFSTACRHWLNPASTISSRSARDMRCLRLVGNVSMALMHGSDRLATSAEATRARS